MKKQILVIILLSCILAMAGCRSEQNKNTQSEVDIKQTESAMNTEIEELGVIEANIETVGIPIKEQCLEVIMDDWGAVTFASYAPENTSFQPNGLNPDVRFYLIDKEYVLYEFPGWNEEHTNADLFVAVSAVAFKDYNDDGLKDVITLCEYETMSGEGYQLARIYFQLEEKREFEEDTLLTEYLIKQYKTDSVAAIFEVKEEYYDYKSSLDGHRSFYNQLIIIAENKDMWTENLQEMGEVCYYAVSDLDHNGRYEIIVSCMGGTGRFSNSSFFEVNENYDGLRECDTDFGEGNSEPDIINYENWETYIDDDGVFHYVVSDWVRIGAAQSYQSVMEITLQNGEIATKLLANKETIYEEEATTIICTDPEGNVISEEEFENLPEKYFAGYEKRTTYFGWQNAKEVAEDVEEIIKQLEASFDIYSESQ